MTWYESAERNPEAIFSKPFAEDLSICMSIADRISKTTRNALKNFFFLLSLAISGFVFTEIKYESVHDETYWFPNESFLWMVSKLEQ